MAHAAADIVTIMITCFDQTNVIVACVIDFNVTMCSKAHVPC